MRACVKGGMQSSFFFIFFFFTFEQEIVFIVSVPHSRRGRSNACLRKRMDEEYGYEMSLYARKKCGKGLWWDSAPVLDVKASWPQKGRAPNSAEGGEESLHFKYLPRGGALYWHASRWHPAGANRQSFNCEWKDKQGQAKKDVHII